MCSVKSTAAHHNVFVHDVYNGRSEYYNIIIACTAFRREEEKREMREMRDGDWQKWQETAIAAVLFFAWKECF